MTNFKSQKRQARQRRIRAKVYGTASRPRLAIHRSLLQITAQVIDDETGKTLLAASTKETKKKSDTEGAKALGTLIAKKAKAAKVSEIVFDRSGYKYHGRIKALADAVREGGIKF